MQFVILLFYWDKACLLRIVISSELEECGVESKFKIVSPSVFVTDIIDSFLQTVQYGCLILTVQDGVVVRIEKNEKFTITAQNRKTRYTIAPKAGEEYLFKMEILTELQQIKYGQLSIQLEKGKLQRIEKTEKWRTDELRGINGEGI